MSENSFAVEPISSAEVTPLVEGTALVLETNLSEGEVIPDSLKSIEGEAPGFFSKLKNAGEKVVEFFSHEEARKQVAESAVSMVASVAGVKSFYDVPNYLRQRFMVRGINLGPFGQGKGMAGSVERLLDANKEMRGEIGEESASGSDGVEGESHSVRDAINDLNERLALTKEGDQKGSEQRKMIAKLLMENRTKEQMNAEARSERMTTILDEYTTTKVTGMQATRETLNTALVASGTMSLRGVSYGILDGVERYQRLNKEAGEGAKPEIFKDVILGGINETLEEATFRNSEDKSKLRSGLDSVKAWGKILRVVGMGSTMSLRPEALGSDMEKVLDAFSGKVSLGDVTENFQGSIDRTIEGYARVAKAVNPFQVAEANAGDFSPKMNPGVRVSRAMEVDLDEVVPVQGKGSIVLGRGSDSEYLPGGGRRVIKDVINEIVPKEQKKVVSFNIKNSMDKIFTLNNPKGGKMLYDINGPAPDTSTSGTSLDYSKGVSRHSER
jgi:polyhydroxyalkanoate synthesis regulator phasin